MAGNKRTVASNPECVGLYSFTDFIATAVCYINPLATGRYLGIVTTKNESLQLCEVEVCSRGNRRSCWFLRYWHPISASTRFVEVIVRRTYKPERPKRGVREQAVKFPISLFLPSTILVCKLKLCPVWFSWRRKSYPVECKKKKKRKKKSTLFECQCI